MTPIDQGLEDIIQACFRNPADVNALTSFDEAFRPYLMAITVSLQPRGTRLAEDAYQSAFVKFLEIFMAGPKPGIAYVPYFVAIVKNCLIDELRRQRRHVPLDIILDEDFPGKSSLDDEERMHKRIALLQAMTHVSTRCQFLLTKYYVAETDISELARHLGIQPQSVYMLLKRCREELKNLLS